ncbi:MAG: VWA domain-containing protein [Chitinophagaceae bacterium]
MLEFQYPVWWWALLLLPLVTLLFWLVVRWKKNTMRKIGDPELVKTLLRGDSPRRFTLSHILLTLAAGLLVAALANLRKPSGGENISRTGVDVMVALDVSKSMMAQDVAPNRMEKAKHLVAKMLDELGNDRVGLVIFAGHAYFQMPLTTDLAAARLYINSASPAMVSTQGTVIGEALRLCNSAFNPKEKKYKAVLLITDGEDHDPDAVATAQAMAENGVMISTVGVGSREGARIPDEETGDFKRDEAGNVVVSALNEQLLRDIATAGNGEYVQLVSTDMAVKGLRDRLDTLEQRTVSDKSQANYKSFFYWFVLGAAIFLLAEFLVNAMPSRFSKYKVFLAKKQTT